MLRADFFGFSPQCGWKEMLQDREGRRVKRGQRKKKMARFPVVFSCPSWFIVCIFLNGTGQWKRILHGRGK